MVCSSSLREGRLGLGNAIARRYKSKEHGTWGGGVQFLTVFTPPPPGPKQQKKGRPKIVGKKIFWKKNRLPPSRPPGGFVSFSADSGADNAWWVPFTKNCSQNERGGKNTAIQNKKTTIKKIKKKDHRIHILRDILDPDSCQPTAPLRIVPAARCARSRTRAKTQIRRRGSRARRRR